MFFRVLTRSRVALLAVTGCLSTSGPAFAAEATVNTQELAAQVETIDRQLKAARDQIELVEKQYTLRAETSEEMARLQRFSDAEIQYLLGDYDVASVLFYDLVANKDFQSSPRYPDALFYLSDSLYQQKNYVGAKVYLRELITLQSKHSREALARYLEIAGRLNEFSGIDEYINKARGQGGELPPEISYVYGKWMFNRTDLPLAERLERAKAIFAPLSMNPGAPFRMQAGYFIGVGEVKRKNYPAAVEQFKAVVALKAQTARDAKVRELANLSLGRVLFEQEKFDESIDRYQEIPRESEYFVDSLYEIAWAQVKKGELERAKNATDILLLVAPESTIAPEAKILQGNLLLKLHRYTEATDAYNQVINEYGVVRDEVGALIESHQDPVRYFDDLLAKSQHTLDVNTLLPPVALKWATTQREVAEAVQMVSDLEIGRHGVQEGRDIAAHVLKALEERGLETFPALQEGYTRADAVDSALTQIDQSLVRIEGYLVSEQLTPEERARLEASRAELDTLKARFDTLPTTEKEVQQRRQRRRDKVDDLDKQAFKLGYDVQSMFAVVSALEKWLVDSKPQRKNTAEDEKAFVEKMKHEVEALTSMQKELETVRQALTEEKASSDSTTGTEDKIRDQYEAALNKQHEILSAAESRMPAAIGAVLARAHDVRERAVAVRSRVDVAKQKLKDQVGRRGKQISDTVTAEQAILVGYNNEVNQASGDARQLVGRIAFDSFKRVHRQFHELVLKADVGVVDVAFTRKQDKTGQIQKLATQKDRELKALDEEFKEVLKDVD